MVGMDPEVIARFCEEVPSEIRDAITPLKDEKAWAVFIALLKNGPMTFGQIKNTFGTDSSGDIDKYLKSLKRGGLIVKQASEISAIGDPLRSMYTPTIIGRSLMKAFFDGLIPHPKPSEDIPRLTSASWQEEGYRVETVSAGGVYYLDMVKESSQIGAAGSVPAGNH